MNHGERAKPSLLLSTAKARAPMQRRLLAPVVRAAVVCVDGEDPMRKGPPPPSVLPSASACGGVYIRRRSERSRLEEEEQREAASWTVRWSVGCVLVSWLLGPAEDKSIKI